jgi:hypothetical protein
MARAGAGSLLIRPRRPVCPLYPHGVKNIEQLLTALAFTRHRTCHAVKQPLPECCYNLLRMKKQANNLTR